METGHHDIRTFFFDFGGVVAEEGFFLGLREIAVQQGLEPDAFFRTGEAVIAESGYLTGTADEALFWNMLRFRSGVRGSDEELRQEILSRFVLRPEVLASVDRLRERGMTVCLLSDQTNWLEEIDAATSLFRRFDRVFNSWRRGKSKRDASVFSDVCSELGVLPGTVLFIDDNAGHIERAGTRGLKTLQFTDIASFGERIRPFLAQQT